MNVNWKVRIKNKVFWLAIIPAVLVLIQKVLVVFGVSFDPTVLSGQLTDIIESVFLVLAIIGIVERRFRFRRVQIRCLRYLIEHQYTDLKILRQNLL